MIAIQQQQQPAINNKALAWTIGVHALLLLLFFFLRYTIVNPPLVTDGGGLEVNLGTSETGSGSDQPMSTKKPAPYQASVVFKSAPSKATLPKDIIKSNDGDAPVVDNTKVKNTSTEAGVKSHAKEIPKYTYQGDKGQGGNDAAQNKPGKGEGVAGGPGDQGVPGGTPGATNYTGIPGNGSGGIGHTLSGRKITPEVFEAEFHESGKVVIHVTVDRNGNIIDRRVKSSSSAQLTKLALEKLNDARFSKSEGPEPQQFGDVTIIFKTRQ